MEIKTIPSDFCVREIIEFPKNSGNYAYFLIKKEDLNTIDAINIIKKYLGISKRRIRFIGEKDKRAITEQYVSIVNINKDQAKKLEELNHPKLSIKFVGFYDQPVHLGLLKKNYFRVIVRNVNDIEKENFEENIKILKKIGFPNYFDEQRFGKQRPINHIVGYCILKRRYDLAVKKFLTLHSPNEHPLTIEARKYLKENWGEFKITLRLFPKWLKPERAILHYLTKNPENFKEALKQLHPKLLRLFVNSLQSYIFNKILSEIINRSFEKKGEIEFSFDRLYFPKEDKKVKIHKMPIIGSKTKLNKYPEEVQETASKILNRYFIDQREFDFNDFRILRSEGTERLTFVIPENLGYEIKKDCFILKFYLPPGSYATMLIKYLFLA